MEDAANLCLALDPRGSELVGKPRCGLLAPRLPQPGYPCAWGSSETETSALIKPRAPKRAEGVAYISSLVELKLIGNVGTSQSFGVKREGIIVGQAITRAGSTP
jgi:hypothetical protein